MSAYDNLMIELSPLILAQPSAVYGCLTVCSLMHPIIIIMSMHQVRLSLEAIRADVEEFGGKAYRMGKGSKDDAVVALLKDQLDEFKQVSTCLPCMHLSTLFIHADQIPHPSSCPVCCAFCLTKWLVMNLPALDSSKFVQSATLYT